MRVHACACVRALNGAASCRARSHSRSVTEAGARVLDAQAQAARRTAQQSTLTPARAEAASEGPTRRGSLPSESRCPAAAVLVSVACVLAWNAVAAARSYSEPEPKPEPRRWEPALLSGSPPLDCRAGPGPEPESVTVKS
eukprot:108675-Rhodomonas_salina.1